jgi:hypothetical protein
MYSKIPIDVPPNDPNHPAIAEFTPGDRRSGDDYTL